MNQELFEQAAQEWRRVVNPEQWSKAMEPARRMNAVMIEHAQKLAQLNLDAARSFTEMTLAQARSAMEIKDPEDLRNYLSEQTKAVESFTKEFSKDASMLADLGKSFGDEMQKAAQENVVSFSKAFTGTGGKTKGRAGAAASGGAAGKAE